MVLGLGDGAGGGEEGGVTHYITQQVRVRLSLESNKATTGAREANHTAEHKKSGRRAETTAAAAARITEKEVRRKFG